jgi:hypothetical protein
LFLFVPQYEINYGAIKPVGMRGGNRGNGIGRGIGKITDITNTTLTGEVYFEMHPDQLSRNKGWYQESLIVELYGGIEFGLSDCDEGIMLGKRLVDMNGINDVVDNFEYLVVPFEEYNSAFLRESIECHPRSVNGQLTSMVFTLNDPFYYNEQSASIMNLWYPFRVDVDFGSMEFCVRVEMIDPSYSSEDDDFSDDYFKKRNVTSYIDTKFKVEVSAPSATNNFTRYQEDLSEVKVYSNQAIGPTEYTTTYLPLRYSVENITQSPTSAPTQVTEIFIPVVTYLCSAPDESDVAGSYDQTRTFLLGQTFRLCVGPTYVYEKDYRVVDFQNIVCANNDQNMTLIDEFGIPNEFTTITTETIGFTKKQGGIITSNHTVSIDSVINADLAGVFPEGEKYFVCTGIVFLEYTGTDEEVDATPQNETEVDNRAAPETIMNDDAENGDSATNNTSVRRRSRQRFRRAADSAGNDDPNHRHRFVSRLLHEEPRKMQGIDLEKGPLDKIEGNTDYDENYDIPFVGDLLVRIDITQSTLLDGVFSTSVDTVTGWWSSSASRESVRNNFFLGVRNKLALGTSVLLSLLFFV